MKPPVIPAALVFRSLSDAIIGLEQRMIRRLVQKHFSIIKVGNPPYYFYLKVSTDSPLLEKNESVAAEQTIELEEGERPSSEVIKKIFKELRESARNLGISYVANLHTR